MARAIVLECGHQYHQRCVDDQQVSPPRKCFVVGCSGAFSGSDTVLKGTLGCVPKNQQAVINNLRADLIAEKRDYRELERQNKELLLLTVPRLAPNADVVYPADGPLVLEYDEMCSLAPIAAATVRRRVDFERSQEQALIRERNERSARFEAVLNERGTNFEEALATLDRTRNPPAPTASDERTSRLRQIDAHMVLRNLNTRDVINAIDIQQALPVSDLTVERARSLYEFGEQLRMRGVEFREALDAIDMPSPSDVIDSTRLDNYQWFEIRCNRRNLNVEQTVELLDEFLDIGVERIRCLQQVGRQFADLNLSPEEAVAAVREACEIIRVDAERRERSVGNRYHVMGSSPMIPNISVEVMQGNTHSVGTVTKADTKERRRESLKTYIRPERRKRSGEEPTSTRPSKRRTPSTSEGELSNKGLIKKFNICVDQLRMESRCEAKSQQISQTLADAS